MPYSVHCLFQCPVVLCCSSSRYGTLTFSGGRRVSLFRPAPRLPSSTSPLTSDIFQGILLCISWQRILNIARGMLPNNQVRVPSTRVVSQSTISNDITDKFTHAASSKSSIEPSQSNYNKNHSLTRQLQSSKQANSSKMSTSPCSRPWVHWRCVSPFEIPHLLTAG